MKRLAFLCLAAAAALSGCSPHFHLDLLGGDELAEVTLSPSPARDKVLVVDLEGIISSGADPSPLAREKNAVASVFERLQRAASDPLVRAVILRLDTPGGEVTASDILYHEVLRFRERTGKPVVGLMMGVAASGGYYVASACDLILAHPTTLTGSIGVISIYPNVESLMAKVGVKVNVIKSGASKDSGTPFREMTGEERALFQGLVDGYYEDFLAAVSKGRKGRIPDADLRRIADGRVYAAPRAFELGLIDGIGYVDDAFRKSLELANLRAARLVAYSYYPKARTNIYAVRPGEPGLPEAKMLEPYLGMLRTGFYYLWLPQSR